MKPRHVVSLVFAGMIVGIVINAIALQHGRPVESVLVPNPVLVEAAALRATPAAAASLDPFADALIEQENEKRNLTRAAQAALVKLGFEVQPSGTLDSATRQALRAFEKARHMPVVREITPRLVRSLESAAESAARAEDPVAE